MQIIIHPVASDSDDTVSVSGDTITHNGTAYDLSETPEGATSDPEGEHPFAGSITREGGDLIVPIRLRYDRTTAENDQPADWSHWTVTITGGDLPDRVVRKPIEEDAA